MCSIAILLYGLINITGFMSPASDYVTMYLVLYLITRWVWLIEKGEKGVSQYALLALGAIFVLTMKLSAGLMIVLAIYPGILLLKNKQWKQMVVCILFGLIILLPFLMRNVIISGWLLYPFEKIDWFFVDWKVPVEILLEDSAQIEVWGKCLYDVSLAGQPVVEWVSVWWNAQERYHKMLIYGNILAIMLLCFNTLFGIIKRKYLSCSMGVLVSTIIACLCLWFFKAPFVRYGLAFLLALPALAAGTSIKIIKDYSGFL